MNWHKFSIFALMEAMKHNLHWWNLSLCQLYRAFLLMCPQGICTCIEIAPWLVVAV